MSKEAALKQKEDPHYTGHRQRLRERFINNGAAALADYELLEMILYSASPRMDTKPMAKKLLAHFGGFAAVVHATPVELSRVEDIGEGSIAAVKTIHASMERALKDEASQ